MRLLMIVKHDSMDVIMVTTGGMKMTTNDKQWFQSQGYWQMVCNCLLFVTFCYLLLLIVTYSYLSLLIGCLYVAIMAFDSQQTIILWRF